jgi:formate hydrogenlyase transcriptional activator
MVASREFRSDLYYRLNVFPIRIPPLRERKEDIPMLVGYFVQKFAKQVQKDIERIPSTVMRTFTDWDWPGNIRELENLVERSVILTRGKSLEAPLADLRSLSAEEDKPEAPGSRQDEIEQIVKRTLQELNGKQSPDNEQAKKLADQRAKKRTERAKREREEIVRALKSSKGRVGGADGAAARMGVNRTTLLARIKKLGIDPKEYVA